MTSPQGPPETRSLWQRLYTTRPLTAAAVIIGWFGVLLVYQQHWLGFVLCIVTSVLTMVALRRGRSLAAQQRSRLQLALERAAARNRELEELRHLAATLLGASDVKELFREIAKATAQLLGSQGSSITLVVEEGRFLKVVAAYGMLEHLTGTLIPVDHSMSGWVVTHDEPMVSDEMRTGPANLQGPGTARSPPVSGDRTSALQRHRRRNRQRAQQARWPTLRRKRAAAAQDPR